MGLTLLETDQDLCAGWLPPVPPDLVIPQESFSPGPPTPRVMRFPATQILPITLLLCLLFISLLPNQLSIEKEFINIAKNAARRAACESRPEVFFLKRNNLSQL